MASTGGHLEEMLLLAPRLTADWREAHWVTFDTPQSRSVLRGCDVTFVPYIRPRGAVRALRSVPVFRRIYRSAGITDVVSTGSAIAVPALHVAAVMGLDATYVESLARTDGPSLTGRLLCWNPRIELRTQFPDWSSGRWRAGLNVLDSWNAAEAARPLPARPRLLVTVGTIRPYGFRRLLDAVLRVAPAGSSITWQTGCTDTSDLPITPVVSLTKRQLDVEIAEADVVIAHAGVGSALSVLNRGKCPILVPRLRAFHEHVDDHQLQIARELGRRGLAVTAAVEDLRLGHLEQAYSRRVTLSPIGELYAG